MSQDIERILGRELIPDRKSERKINPSNLPAVEPSRIEDHQTLSASTPRSNHLPLGHELISSKMPDMKTTSPSLPTKGPSGIENNQTLHPSPPQAIQLPLAAQAFQGILEQHYQALLAQLSNQSSFIFFPQLPVEIRLEIWSMSLPDSRTVPFCERMTTELPVALSVNKESRGEALKQYCLYLHNPDRHKGYERALLLSFSPAIDILQFESMISLTSVSTLFHTFDTLSKMDVIRPGTIVSVKTLEITLMDRYTLNETATLKECCAWNKPGDVGALTIDEMTKMYSFFLLDTLLRFSGLEKIILTLREDDYEDWIDSHQTEAQMFDAEAVLSWETAVSRSLEEHKHRFVKGKAPQLIVRTIDEIDD